VLRLGVIWLWSGLRSGVSRFVRRLRRRLLIRWLFRFGGSPGSISFGVRRLMLRARKRRMLGSIRLMGLSARIEFFWCLASG
jgi:hypothetical protein